MAGKPTLIQRAYRFALAPTAAQQDMFTSHAGGARFAYNWGVKTIADAHDAYAAAKASGGELPKIPNHFGLCTAWTAYKDAYRDTPPPGREHDLSWVRDNFVGAYQAALRDAAGAWQKFHDSRSGRRAGRKMGRPRFKSRHRSPAKFQMHGDSLRMVDKATINLPKVGPVKIPGKIRIGTGQPAWIDPDPVAVPAPRPPGISPQDWKQLMERGHVTMPDAAKCKPPAGKPRRRRGRGRTVSTPTLWVERNARTARKLARLLAKAAAGPATCPTCEGAGRVAVTTVTGKPSDVKCGVYGHFVKPEDKRPGCRGHGTVQRARIVRATISRGASGVWWCSVTVEVVVDVPVAPSRRQAAGGIVGVDLGVRHLATLSTGEAWEPSRALRDSMGALRAAQRHLSRTKDGSSNRAKARLRVGTLHEQVALMRADALHRVSREIAAGFTTVVVEGHDLQQMAQHGSRNVPVRVRKARNTALADTAAGILRWHLDYKTSWSGTTLVKTGKGVPTGRTCSQCGQVRTKPVALTEELFRGDCGHVLDRRVNTARHLAQFGRGDTGSGSTLPRQPRGGGVRPEPGSSGRGHPPVKRADRREAVSPGP